MTMTSLNATGLRSDPVSAHLWDVVENKIYIMDVNRQVCKICQECFWRQNKAELGTSDMDVVKSPVSVFLCSNFFVFVKVLHFIPQLCKFT